MTEQRQAGTADHSVYLDAINTADGTKASAFAYNQAGIALFYCRNRAADVAITPADLAADDTAHTDGGVRFIANGLVRIDLPDAALAAGVPSLVVGGSATGITLVPKTIQLTGYDPADTALTAADIAAAIFARAMGAVNANLTFDELCTVLAAALAGKSSGVAAGSPIFRSIGDTKDVITATASQGDRSAVTLTP